MNAEDQVGNIFKRVGRWVKTHRLHTIVIIGVILIAAAASVAFAILSQSAPKVETVKTTPKPKPAPKFYSLLDGRQVADEAAQKSAVTAIMIENSPDARPQSGIKQAEVVYEAIAEGGITRFLCLYQQNKPGLIGPVRSLRMYYVDWAAPYRASFAHIGGSAAALAEVRNGTHRDIDQFFNAGSYWRAGDRAAPHNVYTSFERLDALNTQKGFATSEFSSFPRADMKPADTPNATSITVQISSPLYNSHYSYDAASNTYLRDQGDAPHMDREEGQVSPSVVVALKVNMEKVMEDGWRESIATAGTGQAYVFQNGTVTEVTWSKSDRMRPLKLTDADGKEISLGRGQTWITAVPNGSGNVSWQ